MDAAPGDGEGDRAAGRAARARSRPHQPRLQGAGWPRTCRRPGSRAAIAEAERQAPDVPAFDEQRAEGLEQVGDRVGGGDVVEPVGLHQFQRQRHRGEEEEDEEDREEALHRLAGAGAQGGEEADASRRRP